MRSKKLRTLAEAVVISTASGMIYAALGGRRTVAAGFLLFAGILIGTHLARLP